MDEQERQRIINEVVNDWVKYDYFQHFYSSEKLRKAELLVREAEEKNDSKALFQALSYVCAAATNGGLPDKAVVAFSRQLAMMRLDPAKFPEDYIFRWHYKWIVPKLARFPGIPRGEIDEACERMAACYKRNALSQRVVFGVRAQVCLILGEQRKAREWLARRDELPRDDGCDCVSCELWTVMDVLGAEGRDADILEAARPVLDEKIRPCGDDGPYHFLASLLLPCLRLGRREEALRYHLWGYRLVEGKARCLAETADHMAFLSLAAALPSALKALEAGLPLALETADTYNQLLFFIAAAVLARRLCSRGTEPVKIALPKELSIPAEDGAVPARALGDRLADKALVLARAFDQRNGNSYYQDKLSDISELDQYRCELLS